jgi:alkylation response protein AidB-like acyl-CoA dehydrogenase
VRHTPVDEANPISDASARSMPLAELAECHLGDPLVPGHTMSFAYAQRIDESESFPHEAIHSLYQHRFQRYFVPGELGGSFRSFVELGELIRVLSRRDLTCSVAFSTLFWSFLTWMEGSAEQKRFLADFILRREGAMCLAYSEKTHGSDLLGGDTVARRVPDGFLVSGEKWPINRATVSGVCYLLATTNEAAGPRKLSLFMVDKSRLDKAQFSNLPKAPTHGLRGSDISGIRFENCHVPTDALIGHAGAGLEIALKGFQITRALCAPFSLGAGDTALRTALHFVSSRTLYGERVVDIPHCAGTLSDAFIDLLICDCVTTSGLRAFHAVPEQISVWSAVVKYFVPTAVESMIQRLSVVMGARGYMRDEHEWGTFQRVIRDAPIVSIFDGSTVVNLHALLLQFRQLARRRADNADQERDLRRIFDLDAAVDMFDPKRLSLASRHGNAALDGFGSTLSLIKSRELPHAVGTQVLERIVAFGEQLAREIELHRVRFASAEFENGHRQPAEAFETARKYCGLHAAAACLHAWARTGRHTNKFFVSGAWLPNAGERIFEHYLGHAEVGWANSSFLETLEELRRLDQEGRMFSIAGSPLGTQISTMA